MFTSRRFVLDTILGCRDFDRNRYREKCLHCGRTYLDRIERELDAVVSTELSNFDFFARKLYAVIFPWR